MPSVQTVGILLGGEYGMQATAEVSVGLLYIVETVVIVDMECTQQNAVCVVV